MANVKQILISGQVPFDLADHPGIRDKLGQMNAPALNLKIAYGLVPIEHRPNSNGGRTAYYDFAIKGTEAVSANWLRSLVNDLKEIGATITQTDIYDIEGAQQITLE